MLPDHPQSLILAPYTKVFPETREALEKHAPDAILAQTPGLFGYADAVIKHWNTGQDLIIIEQSIVVRPDVFESFAVCPSLWCTYAYELSPGVWTYFSTGCARFSAELQETFPVVPRFFYPEVDLCLLNLFLPLTPCMHGIVTHLNHRGEGWEEKIYQSKLAARLKFLDWRRTTVVQM